jgi:hypothetical protein
MLILSLFFVTTQVHRGKGTEAQSFLAYVLLNFSLCAFAPLPLCAYLSSYYSLFFILYPLSFILDSDS